MWRSWVLNTFFWVECHWGKTPWYLVSSMAIWGWGRQLAPSYLEFAPCMVKAFLHPRPGYVPKVPANVVRSIMLQAFCPTPFQNADQERYNLLCPVRSLDVHRASLWRKNYQLFVCFGSPNKGSPVSKQRMNKWGGRGHFTCLWAG